MNFIKINIKWTSTKFENTASKDLSRLLQTDVEVKFQDGDRVNKKFDSPNNEWDIDDFHNVDLLQDEKDFVNHFRYMIICSFYTHLIMKHVFWMYTV